jgi:large subunit ribosomal protein L5
MTDTATTARLKTRYLEEIRPALIGRFGYSSVMQAPKLEKITVNMGVGLAKQDSKMLKAAREQLATITGQQPSVRRARKSIAAFKLREGMPVGVAVTLRAERGYEFLDRLVSIAIPRIRDFRGLNPRSFDGRGNYSLGVREQIIFPEIDYDAIDEVRGLDITITTSASTDVEAFALLSALGMPFTVQGRPVGFDPPGSGPAADAEGQSGDAPSNGSSPRAEQPQAAPQPPEEASAEPGDGVEASAEPGDAAEATGDEAEATAEPGGAGEQPDAVAAAEPSASSEKSERAEDGGSDADENNAPDAGDSDTAEKGSSD